MASFFCRLVLCLYIFLNEVALLAYIHNPHCHRSYFGGKIRFETVALPHYRLLRVNILGYLPNGYPITAAVIFGMSAHNVIVANGESIMTTAQTTWMMWGIK